MWGFSSVTAMAQHRLVLQIIGFAGSNNIYSLEQKQLYFQSVCIKVDSNADIFISCTPEPFVAILKPGETKTLHGERMVPAATIR